MKKTWDPMRLDVRAFARESATLHGVVALADMPRLAAMAAKESVNRAFESVLSDGVMFERRLFHALFSRADQKEGMDAFVNKRKPQFTNR